MGLFGGYGGCAPAATTRLQTLRVEYSTLWHLLPKTVRSQCMDRVDTPVGINLRVVGMRCHYGSRIGSGEYILVEIGNTNLHLGNTFCVIPLYCP
jgi:hypothetical protein